jgi:hypothetical protein
VADGAEHGVGVVAVAALEVIAAERRDDENSQRTIL